MITVEQIGQAWAEYLKSVKEDTNPATTWKRVVELLNEAMRIQEGK